MEYMSNCDFYEIRFASTISDSDRKVLIDLYQPIVGPVAISLFFKFWSDAQTDQETGFYSIDKLITYLRITSDALLNSRRLLEAMGLLKTYVKVISEERKTYMFCLYAPKQPKEFFDDIFFKELLIKYIGEKDVQRLTSYYRNRIDLTDFKDITTKFGEVFYTDINNFKNSIPSNIPTLVGREEGNVYTSFDIGKFLTLLASKNIKDNFLTKEEIEKISKIATIYGADEEILVRYFEYYCDFYAEKGKRLSEAKLVSTLRDNINYIESQKPIQNPKNKNVKVRNMAPDSSEFADFIKLVEITPPVEFLKLRQNNTAPAFSDIVLLKELATEFKLPNDVINVLIGYALDAKKNMLIPEYVKKIASAMNREGVTNAIETMNYLSSFSRKKVKNKDSDKPSYQPKASKKLFDEEDNVEYNEDLEDED